MALEGAAILNEEASSTVPSIVTSRSKPGTGLGGVEGEVSLIVENTEVLTGDSSGNITLPGDLAVTGDLTTTGDSTVPDIILPAIAATLVKTAVAWAWVDTDNDSDGGRKVTKGNLTASLGNQKSKGLLVLEAATLNLYDMTDPAAAGSLVKSWVVAGGTSVAYRDGLIVYGGTGGLYTINLITDEVHLRDATNYSKADQTAATYNQGTATFTVVVATPIVNATINKVAITVLDNAPIDSGTTLPIPTLVAFTDAGASVVNNNGVVADLVDVSGDDADEGIFDRNKNLYYTNVTQGNLDMFLATNYGADDTTPDDLYDAATTPALLAAITATPQGLLNAGDNQIIGHATGLTVLRANPTTQASGIVAYVTSTYSTGWMIGDIRGAWLSGSVTADRSLHANALTENGTVPVTTVTNGVDWYGPYTAANNHTAASNAEWDVNTTGAFYIKGWFDSAGNSAIESYQGFAKAGDTVRCLVTMQADGTIRAVDDGATAAVNTDSPIAYDDGVPHQYIFARTSSTARTLYIDGVAVASNTTDAGSLTDTGALPYAIGVDSDGSTTPATTSKLTLAHCGATVITAEAAKYMYETEKPIATGRLALLSAADVNAESYNAIAGQASIKSAAAYDYLHGLEVVTRGEALTATTDLGFDKVQVNGSTDVRVSIPTETLRDQLDNKSAELAKARNSTRIFNFTTSGGATTWPVPAGWKADGTMLNISDGTFAVTAQADDGFIWTMTGLTTAKEHEVRIRRV